MSVADFQKLKKESLSEHIPDIADHLVEKIATQKDRQSFKSLFIYYAPRIKSYLLKNNCSETLAEEITQDTMTNLWLKASLFNPQKSSLATWLFTIARNRRIDLIRKDKSDRLSPHEPSLLPASCDIDDEAPDRKKREERVKKAISTLPEEQRSMIKLSFFEGKAHAQIAQETDLPLGTVKSRIRLAFNRLRKELSKEEISPS